ncbi:MAG: SDR family NAD(P)-dependent oxidoreductase [Polyangiaceae bacterium]
MANTIVVCGHGPGISDAVARKFGGEGFDVALVARNGERLTKAAKALGAEGVNAKAFPCDLGDPAAVRAMLRDVRESFGPIRVLHWNAYVNGAGDLTNADTSDLQSSFAVSVVGLVSALQEVLPDLEQDKLASALLVTGGGFAFHDKSVNAMAAEWNAMGLAVAKAAQHKAVGVLRERLAKQQIYVGEVVVTGMVKGTAFDSGSATLEASTVANKFWELYKTRAENPVVV